jgi:DNA-binding winged helix-turn-helix (wHTH) protein
LRVRFEDLTFDAVSRQLSRGSTEIHLTLKAFDLLRLLIERRPAVVSKEEIQAHLWPTTFVSEANLPSLVAEIRTALGDTARQPRFIRTVHGFGYAFCGQAEVEGRAPVTGRSRYSLVWETKQLALNEGETIVGRDRDLGVTLESSSVSRRHCVIRVAANSVTVEDLESKNGTFVRDERITGVVSVAAGDRIRVGTIVLTLVSDEGTMTETQTSHEEDRR